MFLVFSLNTNVFAAGAEWDAFKVAMTDSTASVTLDADVVGEAETITVTGTKTLDLGGKTLTLKGQLIVEGNLTITGSGKVFSDNLGDMIVVKPGATLTVEDVELEATAYKAGAIQIYGTTGKNTIVNIEKDAKITANYAAYISQPGGQGITLNVKGKLYGLYTESGTKTNGGKPLYVNGLVTDTSSNAPVINIYEGAELIADKTAAVYAAGYAVWNIYGGTFYGEEALSIKAGTFNIKGGTFYANGKFVDPVTPEYNASESSGSAISITSNKGYLAKKIELNIEYAEIVSENGYAILEVATDVDTNETTYVENIVIEDGIFYGGKAAVLAENVDKFVQGGIYNTDIKDYTDTTKLDVVEDKENEAFFVGTLRNVNVKDSKGGKVTVSFDKAVEGQIIKVTAKANEGYKMGEITVKDASGKEIEVDKDGYFWMPASEVTVSVAFKALPLDNTPATGSIDRMVVVSAIVALVAMAGIVAKRKVGNN